MNQFKSIIELFKEDLACSNCCITKYFKLITLSFMVYKNANCDLVGHKLNWIDLFIERRLNFPNNYRYYIRVVFLSKNSYYFVLKIFEFINIYYIWK